MNYYDPEKAAKVWQRVQGSTDTMAVGLQGLLLQAVSDEKTYIALSRRAPEDIRKSLQKMARQEARHIACLKGICTLVRGAAPQITAPTPQADTLDAALRKCYRNALQSLAAYESRSSDSDYGAAFAQMAAEKRAQCVQILSLLGNYCK